MNKVARKQFSEPHTYRTEEGAEVEHVHEYSGYGFSHYTITGTPEQIVAEGERIMRRYPPQAYSGQVYWPPEKWQHYKTPVEVSPGIWKAQVWHSESCE